MLCPNFLWADSTCLLFTLQKSQTRKNEKDIQLIVYEQFNLITGPCWYKYDLLKDQGVAGGGCKASALTTENYDELRVRNPFLIRRYKYNTEKIENICRQIDLAVCTHIHKLRESTFFIY